MAVKPLKKITREIKDTAELIKTLKSFSIKYGGAWVPSIVPFTHTTEFYKYQSPSKVPDYMFDIARNRIGWKGKIVEFTEAAQIREEQRAYSGDR